MAQKQHSVRIYIDADLSMDNGVVLDKAQAHYVGTVMRRKIDDEIVMFNGRDGEWLGKVQEVRKNHALVSLVECLREQTNEPDIHLAFSPVKKIQNALIIQKATELGVSELVPVQTLRTNSDRPREDKMLMQAIEAAEQSERLTVPIVQPPQKLEKYLARMEPDRALIFCHERHDTQDPIAVLSALPDTTKYTVLVGPEGGFSDAERKMIMSCDNSHTLGLGSRILRAETAVVSALSLLQAVRGDWQ